MDDNIEQAITELKEKVERYFAGKVKRGPKPRWPRRLKEQAVELLLRGVSRDELATSTGTKPSNITRWYRDYKRREQIRKCRLEGANLIWLNYLRMKMIKIQGLPK